MSTEKSPKRIKLSEQDMADLELFEKAKKAARVLGNGYKVVGVGPGALLTSPEFPRFSIDLPEAVIRTLADVDEQLNWE